MTTVLAPRKADISDHANQPTSWNKNPEAVPPNFLDFVVKGIVTGDQSELAFALRILF